MSKDISVNNTAKIKKPFYKKWWFILLVVVGVIGVFSDPDESKETIDSSPNNAEEVAAKDTSEEDSAIIAESTKKEDALAESESIEKVEEAKAAEEEKFLAESIAIEESRKESVVPREHENALSNAYDYLDYTSFSKSGLYDQLVYEGYPADAVQYAIENVKADWNANALQAAIDYLDYSSFSDQGLYDQLIYEEYTSEQAQYAIDNLP
ncbi:Ltp family lipoprotein [Carnobacterium sp. ISL-102]|nr:Ltp family lipoprotein [Carnobacterium sp. ISL-102]